jgi:hypothetical protein
MRRILTLCGLLFSVSALGALPGVAGADTTPLPSQVNVQYHGGPLLQHVQVSTLFVGPWWDNEGRELRDYLNQFLTDLFADRRYMANLSQYSADQYQIGNGALAGGYTHWKAVVPARVTDVQIEDELAAALAAGVLGAPGPDSLYFIFTPPGVVVHSDAIGDSVHGTGSDRTGSWYGYHSFIDDGQGGQIAYALVPYYDDYDLSVIYPEYQGNPHLMTETVSHELAEAVTDPRPPSGWTDPQFTHGDEIGDIPKIIYSAMWQTASDQGQPPPDPRYVWDVLTGSDGRRFLVQKVWSMKDGAPVAFAQSVNNGALKVKIGR